MSQKMTTKEVAEYLRLREITVCKYAADGKIPAIRIGRVWRFDKDALDAWIGGDKTKGRGRQHMKEAPPAIRGNELHG